MTVSKADVEKAIWEAKAGSYQNQESEFTIPASKLDKIVTIPLGFQPAGISLMELGGGGDQIAIADYLVTNNLDEAALIVQLDQVLTDVLG